jgi:hypothetical protein
MSMGEGKAYVWVVLHGTEVQGWFLYGVFRSREAAEANVNGVFLQLEPGWGERLDLDEGTTDWENESNPEVDRIRIQRQELW